jgi:hypothetical protein
MCKSVVEKKSPAHDNDSESKCESADEKMSPAHNKDFWTLLFNAQKFTSDDFFNLIRTKNKAMIVAVFRGLNNSNHYQLKCNVARELHNFHENNWTIRRQARDKGINNINKLEGVLVIPTILTTSLIPLNIFQRYQYAFYQTAGEIISATGNYSKLGWSEINLPNFCPADLRRSCIDAVYSYTNGGSSYAFSQLGANIASYIFTHYTLRNLYTSSSSVSKISLALSALVSTGLSVTLPWLSLINEAAWPKSYAQLRACCKAWAYAISPDSPITGNFGNLDWNLGPVNTGVLPKVAEIAIEYSPFVISAACTGGLLTLALYCGIKRARNNKQHLTETMLDSLANEAGFAPGGRGP